MAAPWDSALGLWGTAMSNNTRQGGTQVVRKNLSQEAIDKLIYDALSSDGGLAALASGENLAGGSKSSSKTLLAQDMMTKLIGELASITAETETTTSEEKSTKEGRFLNKFADNTGTVICTELKRQGLLSSDLYTKVGPPWKQVSYFTWKGYYIWASKVVPLMKKSPTLSRALLPVVRSRYELLAGSKDFCFWGRVTQIFEIPCYILGAILAHVDHFKDLKNGRIYTNS
jgi:hypothetical protein